MVLGRFQIVYNSASNSDGSGRAPLSYWNYLNALVSRYADSPALGMWEPMSEPEASTCPAAYEPSNCEGHQTCPDEAAATAALDYFFTTVGARSTPSTLSTWSRPVSSVRVSAARLAATTRVSVRHQASTS